MSFFLPPRSKSRSRSRRRSNPKQSSPSKTQVEKLVFTGQQFSVDLEENPTTGYSTWFDEKKTNAPVKFVTERFVPHENKEMRSGSGGIIKFIFEVPANTNTKALGVHKLRFVRGRKFDPKTHAVVEVPIRVEFGGPLVYPGTEFVISLPEQAEFTWTLADPTYTNGTFPIQLKSVHFMRKKMQPGMTGGSGVRQFTFTVQTLKMESEYTEAVPVPIAFLYHRGDQMSSRSVRIEKVFYSSANE